MRSAHAPKSQFHDQILQCGGLVGCDASLHGSVWKKSATARTGRPSVVALSRHAFRLNPQAGAKVPDSAQICPGQAPAGAAPEPKRVVGVEVEEQKQSPGDEAMNRTPEHATRFQDAILDPSKVFDEPDDVVTASGFTDKQKAAILDRWKDDSIQLMRAADENMAGGERNHLAAVEKAMAKLASRAKDTAD
jgi:hypothetical protein